GVVHGVVVLQAGVSQFDRSAQLFCGAQDILQVGRSVHRQPSMAAGSSRRRGPPLRRGWPPRLHVGATECAVGGGELLGPIPGRVSGAIFERPVTAPVTTKRTLAMR